MPYVGEYGSTIRIDVGMDISGYSTIQMLFDKPGNTSLTVSNPDVTVGLVDVTTTAGVFHAKEYAEYTFKNGDLNLSGNWKVRVVYIDANKKLISAIKTFAVSN